MHDHHHDHGEHCTCHDHEHHHDHDEHCSCHDHEHHHDHDEHCTCHDHEHHHDHDGHCTCHDHEHHHDHDHHHQHEAPVPGVVTVNVRHHDEAIVVSGELVLTGDYAAIREKLRESLTAFAASVGERDGIIGHIKASVTAEQVEMFSVTDEEVMIKTAPQQTIRIILAAIVFCVDDREAEQLGRKSLEALL